MGEVKRGLEIFNETAIAALATNIRILSLTWRKHASGCRYAVWIEVIVENFDVNLCGLLHAMLTLTHLSHLWR
jgi:hypothetical protein